MALVGDQHIGGLKGRRFHKGKVPQIFGNGFSSAAEEETGCRSHRKETTSLYSLVHLMRSAAFPGLLERREQAGMNWAVAELFGCTIDSDQDAKQEILTKEDGILKCDLRSLRGAVALFLSLGPLAGVGFALQGRQPGDAEACGACGACAGGLIVIPIVIIALNIALLVWVARDAKARSMDSAVLWMILVMFTSVIGLIIYVFSRPQGNLIRCAHCGNQRLQASARCPHCLNA